MHESEVDAVVPGFDPTGNLLAFRDQKRYDATESRAARVRGFPSVPDFQKPCLHRNWFALRPIWGRLANLNGLAYYDIHGLLLCIKTLIELSAGSDVHFKANNLCTSSISKVRLAVNARAVHYACFIPSALATFAQVSRSVTVRLNTIFSGVESGSTQK